MLGSWPSHSGFSCSFAPRAPCLSLVTVHVSGISDGNIHRYGSCVKAVWSMAIPSREAELPLWEGTEYVLRKLSPLSGDGSMGVSFGQVSIPC
jgi:hypothetical protein